MLNSFNKHTEYETVTEALTDLKKRGYTIDFNLLSEKDCLVCHKSEIELSPDDFQVDESHRFYGLSDPGDEMIVYAISSKNYNVKGILVNGYGLYSESLSSKMVSKLNT